MKLFSTFLSVIMFVVVIENVLARYLLVDVQDGAPNGIQAEIQENKSGKSMITFRQRELCKVYI